MPKFLMNFSSVLRTILLSFLFLIPSVLAFSAIDSFKIINDINRNQKIAWRAGRTRFHNNQRGFIASLGTKFLSDLEVRQMPQRSVPASLLRSAIIPTAFDSREKWSSCSSLHEIRDQGGCGSCWAHAVAESLSDRLCIVSKNQNLSVHVSVQDLMTCCPKCGGCNGGIVEYAFQHFISEGLVSGGDFMTRKGCRPYTVSPNTWIQPFNTTPACSKKCNPAYRKPYADDLFRGASWHVVSKLNSSNPITATSSAKDRALNAEAVRNIQLEILTNGPVTCSIRIHEDFQHYQSGVYTYVMGSFLAGHAMKIIGWGVDESNSNLPYWIVANSWSTDWGESGFARIRRGVNECGIESRINAGMPIKY